MDSLLVWHPYSELAVLCLCLCAMTLFALVVRRHRSPEPYIRHHEDPALSEEPDNTVGPSANTESSQ
jgi:hypothetical protein